MYEELERIQLQEDALRKEIKDLTSVNLQQMDEIDHLKSKNLTLTEINFTLKETNKQLALDNKKLEELLIEEQNKNAEL